MEKFGTVLECMDGRTQRKVADYLTTSFGVRHLDTITTAGTIQHLARDTDQTPALLANVAVSVERHGSTQIAVVAHHDCAGNPVPDKVQKQQVAAAAARLHDLYPRAEVIGLWVGENWILERIKTP